MVRIVDFPEHPFTNLLKKKSWFIHAFKMCFWKMLMLTKFSFITINILFNFLGHYSGYVVLSVFRLIHFLYVHYFFVPLWYSYLPVHIHQGMYCIKVLFPKDVGFPAISVLIFFNFFLTKTCSISLYKIAVFHFKGLQYFALQDCSISTLQDCSISLHKIAAFHFTRLNVINVRI